MLCLEVKYSHRCVILEIDLEVEMECTSGDVLLNKANGNVAYSSQIPWLEAGLHHSFLAGFVSLSEAYSTRQLETISHFQIRTTDPDTKKYCTLVASGPDIEALDDKDLTGTSQDRSNNEY